MRVVLSAFFLLLLGAVSTAGAHQQKSAITRVLFNERTGNIEVMHRFLLHDAEHAVREIFDVAADILASEAVRERFADYIGRRFELRADERLLELKAVGTEIDGRFLWVYQETPIPEVIESLTIRHDALRDIWPAQVNLVNVERGEGIRSVNFEGGRRRVDIELTTPD